MPDREKVIKGLEVCSTVADFAPCPTECPYQDPDVICYGTARLMQDALALLREQEKAGWISVKDRLPEKAGRYLCWFGLNVFCVGADIATFVPEQKAFVSLECARELWNITHWMPLPEPPEDES